MRINEFFPVVLAGTELSPFRRSLLNQFIKLALLWKDHNCYAQNLVIAVQSKISFWKFLLGIFPAMLVGILVNITILLCYFWKLLSTEKDEEMVIAASEMFIEDDVNSHRFSPATMSHLNSVNSPEWSSAVDAIAQSSSLANDPGHIEETLTLTNHISSPEADIHSVAGSGAESPAVSNAPGEVVGGAGNSKRKDDAVVMRRHVRSSNQTNSLRAGSTVQTSDEKEGPIERWKHLLWKTCLSRDHWNAHISSYGA